MFQNFKTLFFLQIPEDRNCGIFNRKWINSRLDPTRDVDYYLLALYTFLFWLGLIFMSLMIADLCFETDLILNAQDFEVEKYNFFLVYSMVMGPTTFLIALYFYIRLRLSISLRDTFIVFLLPDNHVHHVMGKGKCSLIGRTVFGFCCSFVIFFLPHILPITLMNYFHLPKHDLLIFVINLLPVIAVPLGAVWFVYHGLMLEKAIRFFLQIEKEYKLSQHTF